MNLNNRTLWSSLKVPGASVSVRRQAAAPYTVMRVSSVIDIGKGTQTAVLQDFSKAGCSGENRMLRRKDLSAPRKIANLNCVYTSKQCNIVSDACAAIKETVKTGKLAAIVPDVIAPGDFVVFRHVRSRMTLKFAGVLRVVPV